MKTVETVRGTCVKSENIQTTPQPLKFHPKNKGLRQRCHKSVCKHKLKQVVSGIAKICLHTPTDTVGRSRYRCDKS